MSNAGSHPGRAGGSPKGIRGKDRQHAAPAGERSVSMEPRNRIRGKFGCTFVDRNVDKFQWSPETGFGERTADRRRDAEGTHAVSMEPRNRIRGKMVAVTSIKEFQFCLNGAPKQD